MGNKVNDQILLFSKNLLKITGNQDDVEKYIDNEFDVVKNQMEHLNRVLAKYECNIDDPHEFMHYIKVNKNRFILYAGETYSNHTCGILSMLYCPENKQIYENVNIKDLQYLLDNDSLITMESTITAEENDDVPFVGSSVKEAIKEAYSIHKNDVPLYNRLGDIVKYEAILLQDKNTTTLRSPNKFYAGTINHFIIPKVAEKLKTNENSVCHNNITHNGKNYELITYGNKCVAPIDLVDPDMRASLIMSNAKSIINKPIIDISIKNNVLLIDGKPALTSKTAYLHHENENIATENISKTDLSLDKQHGL